MTRLRHLWHAIRRRLWPNNYPRCGLHFSEWFFWPGIGDYCWPCYRDTGVVYSPGRAPIMPEPIETTLERMAAEVPREDWATLPADLTDHLDHYLYGLPKRGERET